MPPRPRPRDWLARRLRAAADIVEGHAGAIGADEDHRDENGTDLDGVTPQPWTGPDTAPRRPGQPPEHWLRTVAAHAPGLLHELGLDPTGDLPGVSHHGPPAGPGSPERAADGPGSPERAAAGGGRGADLPSGGGPGQARPDGTGRAGAGPGPATPDGTHDTWPPTDGGWTGGQSEATRGTAGRRPGPGGTVLDGEAPADGNRPATGPSVRPRIRPAAPEQGQGPGVTRGSEPRTASPSGAGGPRDRWADASDAAGGPGPSRTASASAAGPARPTDHRHTGTAAPAGPRPGGGGGLSADPPAGGSPERAAPYPVAAAAFVADPWPAVRPDAGSARTGGRHDSGPAGTGHRHDSGPAGTGHRHDSGPAGTGHRHDSGPAGTGHGCDDGCAGDRPDPGSSGSGPERRTAAGTRTASPGPSTGPGRPVPTDPWPRSRALAADAHPGPDGPPGDGWRGATGFASPDPARAAAYPGHRDRAHPADAGGGMSIVDPWPALPDEPAHPGDAVVVSPGWQATTARRWPADPWAADPWPALPDDRAARRPAGGWADAAHAARLAAEQRGT